MTRGQMTFLFRAVRDRSSARILLLSLAVLAGCADEVDQQRASFDATEPLSIESWKELPPDLKYDESTFELLRDGTPELQSEEAWGKFMRDVVLGERERDLGTVPGQEVVPFDEPL